MSEITSLPDELNGLAKVTEVRSCNSRKRYTLEYKRRILKEAQGCVAPGELAALVRREGIYFSTLKDFQKQQARGDLDGGASRSHNLGSGIEADLEERLAESEREVRKLRRELERSRIVIDLQKKVSELLGVSLESEQ